MSLQSLRLSNATVLPHSPLSWVWGPQSWLAGGAVAPSQSNKLAGFGASVLEWVVFPSSTRLET